SESVIEVMDRENMADAHPVVLLELLRYISGIASGSFEGGTIRFCFMAVEEGVYFAAGNDCQLTPPDHGWRLLRGLHNLEPAFSRSSVLGVEPRLKVQRRPQLNINVVHG